MLIRVASSPFLFNSSSYCEKLLFHYFCLQQIPFFKEFFHSSSINFRKERLWILRLAYVGLNLDDDAQIYIKNSIIESLMSFYTSSHSDSELKELILEVIVSLLWLFFISILHHQNLS